nr:hypothetical protein [Streptomyces sp. NRRL S-481]
MFGSPVVSARGRPNFARYWFLDDDSHDFAYDWDRAATMTAALLSAEAGRYTDDKALRDLIGELSTLSPEFRTRWATHDVHIHHGGVKRFHHPEAGPLELTYQPLDLPPLRQRSALPDRLHRRTGVRLRGSAAPARLLDGHPGHGLLPPGSAARLTTHRCGPAPHRAGVCGPGFLARTGSPPPDRTGGSVAPAWPLVRRPAGVQRLKTRSAWSRPVVCSSQ